MSDDNETAAIEVLDDAQRIERLEKAGKLDRILIFALAGVLALSLLGWLLSALLGPAEEEDQAQLASRASVEALQKEVAALQLQIAPLQQQLKDQQKMMLLLQKQVTTPAQGTAAAPPASDEQDRDNVRMLARTLIGQERNYQESLTALKGGMRELAGMIAGSRSWLDFYEESLAKPMADSQARVKALQEWSGEKNGSASH